LRPEPFYLLVLNTCIALRTTIASHWTPESSQFIMTFERQASEQNAMGT